MSQKFDIDWEKECTRAENARDMALQALNDIAVKLVQGDAHAALKLSIDAIIDLKKTI
jgi:hypothetical protein